MKGKNGENTFAAGVTARREARYLVRSEGRETGRGRARVAFSQQERWELGSQYPSNKLRTGFYVVVGPYVK